MLAPVQAADCNSVGDGTLGLFFAGNTTGTTSGTVDALSLTFNGAGAASVGLSGGSVMISVIQDGAGINAAIGGNTAGVTALVQTGTLVLNGGNNITLSQDGNQVTVSGAAQSNQQVGLFAVSNTTQSTSQTADARSLSFAGAGAASVGVSGGTVLVSAPTQTTPVMSMFPNFPVMALGSNLLYSGSAGAGGASTNTTVSLWVQPVYLDGQLNFNELRGMANFAGSATTTANFGATGGMTMGLYSMNAGTLSLMSSFSHVVNLSFTSGVASNSTGISGTFGGSDTNGTGTYGVSGSQVAAGVAFGAAQTGLHMIPLLSGTSVRSIAPGQYWAVFGESFITAGQNLIRPFSGEGLFSQNIGAVNDIQLTGGSSSAPGPLQGLYSTVMQSNTVWPLSLATSNISNTNITVTNSLIASVFFQFMQRTT